MFVGIGNRQQYESCEKIRVHNDYDLSTSEVEYNLIRCCNSTHIYPVPTYNMYSLKKTEYKVQDFNKR